MADVIVHGIGRSNYVRTTLMALEEKGVSYDLIESMPQTAEQLAFQPFGKVPAFEHGAVKLFESLAIVLYIDGTFDGPALQPADTLGRARMIQWYSAFSDNYYRPLVRDIIIQRILVPMRGGATDEGVVAAAAEIMDGYFGILDGTLSETEYLAGATYSLADMVYMPAIARLTNLPEARLLDARPNLKDWFDRCFARDASKKILAA
jgi:glutathione S-transferase